LIRILLAAWFVVFIVVGFFTQGIGSPRFIMCLFLPGFPTLIGVCRGFAGIFTKELFSCSLAQAARALFLALVLLVLSLGAIAFFFVFLGELILQVRCGSADCAQGGIGLVFFLPIAWISYALVWLVNAAFVRWHVWPAPLRPGFFFVKAKKSGEDEDTVEGIEPT
jgi:hypothetical protein